MAEFKTNVMRLLEKEKINFNAYEYEHNQEAVDGITVAQKINKPLNLVFKTLVAIGANQNKKEYYVFVIPVAEELNLKRAAISVKEKSISLVAIKDLLKITGYVRGGCSPLGMKKKFKTVISSLALKNETIIVSAGKIGYQIEISPLALQNLINCVFDDITI
ncbi:MAG: Cys-tRNA(Pro) deacylase [Oscillospiraceae bacterium]